MESASEPIVVSGIAAARDADLWVSFNNNTLLKADKKVLLMLGTSLADKHINYTPALMKQQFTCVDGLQSTLF